MLWRGSVMQVGGCFTECSGILCIASLRENMTYQNKHCNIKYASLIDPYSSWFCNAKDNTAYGKYASACCI